MSGQLKDAMRRRFPPEAYALLFEVPNGTGAAKSRSADALTVSLWPSRGLEIGGYEFKSSRSDWLRELKNPEKAESFHQFCDKWYLVTTDNVAKLHELPTVWGWLVLHGGQLRQEKEADLIRRSEWTSEFIAGVMRAATKENMKINENEVRDIENRAVREYEKRLKKSESNTIEKLNERVAELEAIADSMREKLGVKIPWYKWSTDETPAVAKAISAMRGKISSRAKDELGRLVNSLQTVIENANQASEQMDSLEILSGLCSGEVECDGEVK